MHPNGASLVVAIPVRLGQSTAQAASATSTRAVTAPVESTVPSNLATTIPASINSVAADVVEPFQPLVTKAYTASAAVVETGAYIDNEGVKEELAGNVRALNLASDRLAPAEAEASKAVRDAQQKEIEEHVARLDVKNAAAAAVAGSQAGHLEDTAKVETTGLAEEKDSYLLTRGEDEASTNLVAELAKAANKTEKAREAYATARSLAETAKTEADVIDAVSTATVAASAVKDLMQNNSRGAEVATAATKLDEAAAAMAREKLERERNDGIQAANAISARAAGMSVPAPFSDGNPMATATPATTAPGAKTSGAAEPGPEVSADAK